MTKKPAQEGSFSERLVSIGRRRRIGKDPNHNDFYEDYLAKIQRSVGMTNHLMLPKCRLYENHTQNCMIFIQS